MEDTTTKTTLTNSLSIQDHDMLVRLDTKMDSLSAQFSQYYTDITLRVSKLENRMDQEDIYHAAIDMPHFKNNSDWVDNFRANERFLWAIGGLSTSFAGGVITLALAKWFHL